MAAVGTLLERDSELGELELALERAASGEGRCVVLEGAAGIGKTSLLRALRDHAAGAGLTVLSARGTELEQTLPYGVVRQLFERALVRSSAAERQEALAGAAARAAPLLEGAQDGDGAASSEDSAFAVLHGLYWLAANLAERRPLVLAIDDLHWADTASLRWLAYLGHRVDGLPLLAVTTVRPLQGEAPPALADLLADPATLTIRPSPLTREAAAALLGERISVDSFERVSAAAHDATAGNPLLLRELAGALTATGDTADLVAEVERLAPEVISRRVRLELAKLGAEATALAQAVAVIGDDAVCSACIPAQAGLDAGRADGVAGSLARAELLRHGRPLRFVHPLVRQSVYT
ncbi:MAG: AAA family ATPase, partial [Actinomycetota bacterium]|nr:AAA family ATPase [Actinomycetota bacterium]